MDSESISNYIIRGEDGKIVRFLPNVSRNGIILSSIMAYQFYYVKYEGKMYHFADDYEFSLAENGMPRYVRKNEFGVEINKSSKYFAYVLTEANEIKILQFGKTVADIIHNYNDAGRMLNPKNGIGLKFSKAHISGFPNFEGTHFVENLNSYNIGDDNLAVTSFILDNIPYTIDEYIKRRSWYRCGKRREIIEALTGLDVNLTEYLKKFNREDIIDGLLRESE